MAPTKKPQPRHASNDDPLFDLDDFKSHELQIQATNITRNNPAPANAKLSLVEFMKNGLILDTPSSFLAQGDGVELKLRLVHGEKTEQLFMLKGSVTHAETFENNLGTNEAPQIELRDRITVQLSSYDKESWSALQRIYGDRQQAIDQFFKMVRE